MWVLDGDGWTGMNLSSVCQVDNVPVVYIEAQPSHRYFNHGLAYLIKVAQSDGFRLLSVF